MQEQLETLIFLCRTELTVLAEREAALKAEILGYERMLKLGLFDGKALKLGWLGKLTSTWVAILTRLADFTSFRASDVVLVSRDLRRQGVAIKEQTHASARFQLSTYAKRGIIERLGGGNYRLTEKSKVSLELRKMSKPN